MRARCSTLLALAVPAVVGAQAQPTGSSPARASAPLTEVQQIASAVLPLPEEFRAGARVLGYRAGSPTLTVLREGSGPFTCLASAPTAPHFHVACYHQSLEPFMARGRALRAQGVTGERVDTVRFAEVKAGKLAMPSHPAALYSLTGGTYDASSNRLEGARPLFVIYIAGATPESTGLSARPAQGTPWIMFPGTPKAHIMLVPKM